MAFARPTLSELIDRAKTDLEGRLNDGAAVLRRAALAVFARVIGGMSHLMHGHLDYNYKQAFPDTADDANTLRWAALYGVDRKTAEFSEGNYTFTGTNGTSVPALTQIQRADGIVYETQVSGTISGGVLTVAVVSLTAGENGDAISGTTMNLVAPLTGVDSQGTVAAGGLTGGVDEETIESVKARLLDRIRQPPLGGSENDYRNWALEVAGVTRAWVYPLNQGPGTVGVSFVRDDDVGSLIPDAGEVADVQAYIDSLRPVTANVTVFAPVASPLDFTIEITPDTPEIRAAIQTELEDLIKREAEPGGTIPLSHIREAISIADGEVDHDLTVPSADVVESAGDLTTMGTITWV